ncbi:MAG: hypothetical protein L0H31_07680 [Nocardioidaceae bacterium]|nr:hypothetical protein [Nocardioidaceae bacterium]
MHRLTGRSLARLVAVLLVSSIVVGCAEERTKAPAEPEPFDLVIDTLRGLERFDNLTYRGYQTSIWPDLRRDRARVTWMVVPGERTCQKTSVSKRGVETWRQIGDQSYLRLDKVALRKRGFDPARVRLLAGRWVVFPEPGDEPGVCEFDALFQQNRTWEKASPFEVNVRGKRGHRYLGGYYQWKKVFVLSADPEPEILRVEELLQDKGVTQLDLVASNSALRWTVPPAPLNGADYFDMQEF